MDSRTVAFAGTAVRIATSGTAATKVVDFLFGNVSTHRSVPPGVTFRVTSSDDWLALSCDGRSLYEGAEAGVLASVLLTEVTQALIAASTGGLVLHAAALWDQGLALVMPGQSGSGKTTLTGRLLAQGFAYLTDEAVYVASESRDLASFTRPLVVKGEARELLDDVLDLEASGDCVLAGAGTILVWPAVQSSPRPTACRPALFVFPRMKPTAGVVLERLSKARAALALLSCSVNARNLPAHGFELASRLAGQVPAYAITCHGRSQLEAAAREIAGLWKGVRSQGTADYRR